MSKERTAATETYADKKRFAESLLVAKMYSMQAYAEDETNPPEFRNILGRVASMKITADKAREEFAALSMPH